MQSKAATINEYLDELPSDRRTALSELRDLIHRVAPIGLGNSSAKSLS